MHASLGRGGRVCGQCTAGASRPHYMTLPASCILMAVLAGTQHVQSMGHADAARNAQHCMLCIWLHWHSMHAVWRVHMPGWAWHGAAMQQQHKQLMCHLLQALFTCPMLCFGWHGIPALLHPAG